MNHLSWSNVLRKRKEEPVKFSINQSELQDALAVVLKGIATRSTLPILSGIYLDAHNDNLTLQATDLELSIQFTIPALGGRGRPLGIPRQAVLRHREESARCCRAC